MRVNRGQAVLALIGITGLIAGCGSSSNSVSSVAHIRTLNATTNGYYMAVLVNGAATFGVQTLNGVAPAYLYLNSGNSAFSYLTFIDPGETISNLPTNVNPYISTYPVTAGIYYTAYAVGRPDLVTAITSLPFPYGSMQTVVYSDTHTVPAPGSVNVRFLDAAPDANGTGNVDFYVDGTIVPGATNVPFGSITQFALNTSGSHSIKACKTGTSTVVYATTGNLTFTSQRTETLILQEPTAAPIPAPITFTYTIQQIEDN